MTKTRNKAADLSFMTKALKRDRSPKAITTDGLRPCNHFNFERNLVDRETVK